MQVGWVKIGNFQRQTRYNSKMVQDRCIVFSARCNIHLALICYDVSVRLSVRLSVTEVHCGHGACREEGRGHLALC